MLFSLKDNKAGKFIDLMASENAETFKDDILLLWTKGVSNMITQFPSRYDLYEVGGFDEKSGRLQVQEPCFICNCLDIKDMYIKTIESNQTSVDIPPFLDKSKKNTFTPSPSGNEEPAEQC